MTRAQWAGAAAIGATLIGLVVTIALVAAVGFDAVFGILGRIGFLNFVLYAGWTLVILTFLGLGWQLLTPGQSRRTFIWARTMREAATDVLPFSQFGGIVVGLRVLIARRVPQPVAYASLIADQTAELAAQLVYTLYGVAALALVLGSNPGGDALVRLAVLGFGASVAIMLAFAFAQRPMLALAGRIGAAILPDAAQAMAQAQTELDAIYGRRARLLSCFVLHLVAWVISGAGAVIALRAIGQDTPIGNIIVIESLIFTLRTAAFLIPGGIGVQEGAYVLIGPLFGLPPEAALALSLAKRARDLVIGGIAMAIWQASEARAMLREGA